MSITVDVDHQDAVRGRLVTALLGGAKFSVPANEEIDVETAANLLEYYWDVLIEEFQLAGSPENLFPITLDGLRLDRRWYASRSTGVFYPYCDAIERGLVPSPGALTLLAMRCWALGPRERFTMLDSMCGELEMAIERVRSIRRGNQGPYR